MDLDKMLPKENQEMDVNYTLDFTDGVSQYLKGNNILKRFYTKHTVMDLETNYFSWSRSMTLSFQE
jgi:hypothetical protein